MSFVCLKTVPRKYDMVPVGMICQLWVTVNILQVKAAAKIHPFYKDCCWNLMQLGEKSCCREEKRQKRWQIRDDLGRVSHCLRPGGRGCNIFWFLVQQNNPTTELGWGAFQKDLHHLSNFLLAGRIFENHAQSSQYLISWGRRFWTADLPKYPFDFLLNRLNLKLN